jgi:hypothetical protein
MEFREREVLLHNVLVNARSENRMRRTQMLVASRAARRWLSLPLIDISTCYR